MEEKEVRLIVDRAFYGPLNDSNKVSLMDSRSVTLKLRKLVKGRMIAYDQSMNALFGDPAPGRDKFLVVHCRFAENDKRIRTYRFSEDDAIHIRASVSNELQFVNQTSSEAASFEILPTGLIRHIFRYIRRYHTLYCSSLVSKSMHALVTYHVGLTGFDSEYIKGASEYVSHSKKDATFFHSMFLQSRGQLRYLRLINCENVTDSVICEAAKGLAFDNLVSLKLDRCALTDRAIDAIRCATKNLKVLVLKTLTKITDRSIVHILKKNASTLETVNLSGCCSLTDSVLFVIRDELVRLRKLYLAELYRLSDEGTKSLLKLVSNDLQELTLWSVSNVRFQGSFLCLKSFSALSSLNLQDCFNLQDDAVIGLICNFMKSLANLNISYCHKLSDESVEAISLSLPKLRSLNLRYVRRLTDRSVQSLTRLQLLESLNVSFCDKISENAFITLCGLGLSEIRAQKMGFTFRDNTILRLTTIWQRQKRRIGLLDLSENTGLTSNACHIFNKKSLGRTKYVQVCDGVFSLV